MTVCEIKYLQRKVDVGIIEEFERKLSLMPNPKNLTLHKVLIAANGATDGLINRHYFDQIITLEDFLIHKKILSYFVELLINQRKL